MRNNFLICLFFLLPSFTSCVEQLQIETGVKVPYVYCVLSRNYEYQEIRILNVNDVKSVEISEKQDEGEDVTYTFTKISDTLWRAKMDPLRGKTYTLSIIRLDKEPIVASTTYPLANHIRDVCFWRDPNVDYSTFPEGTVGHYLYENYLKSDLIDVWEQYPGKQRCYYADSMGLESRCWLHYPDLQDIVCDSDFFDTKYLYYKKNDSTFVYHRYLRLYKDTNRRYTLYLSGYEGFYKNYNYMPLDKGNLERSIEDILEERTHNMSLNHSLDPPKEAKALRSVFKAKRLDGTQQSFICHNVSVELDLYWQSILRYEALDKTDVLVTMYPEDSEIYSNISCGYGIFGAQDIKWSEEIEYRPISFYDDSGMWVPEKQ